MNAIRLGAATISLVGAFVASGCAGDGGGGGGTVSAEDFRQRADEICADFEARLQEVNPPTSPDDIQRFVNEAVPIIEEGTEELNALDPPAEFRDEWDRISEINEENLDTIRAVREALETDDLQEATRLMEEAGGNEEEADRLAREIGLTECGQDTV